MAGRPKNPEEPSRLTHQTLSMGEAELNIPFFSHDESDGEGQASVDFAQCFSQVKVISNESPG